MFIVFLHLIVITLLLILILPSVIYANLGVLSGKFVNVAPDFRVIVDHHYHQ